MSFKLVATPQFVKSIKKLSKKYKQIKNDLQNINKEIQNKNFVDLGFNCFKLRLANSSIPTGKSGGFRVIYYKKIEDKIYLLEIYSKTELENIDDSKIIEILKDNDL